MKKILIFLLLTVPLLSNAQITEETPVYEIFDVSEKAKFKGGEVALQKYIAKNVKYPPMALENDIQGTVMVMFVVNSKGNIVDVKTVGSANKLLAKEAIRVVKSTSGMWTPAMQRDKAVNMRYRMPIKFNITGGTVKKKKRLFQRNR